MCYSVHEQSSEVDILIIIVNGNLYHFKQFIIAPNKTKIKSQTNNYNN